MTAEICTTPAAKKRHLSTDLSPGPNNHGGRAGRTLCGQHAMDQALLVGAARNFGYGKVPVVAELPPCLSCERSARAWNVGGAL